MEVLIEADVDQAGSDETVEPVNKSVIKAMALLTELGWHPAGITATELAHKMRMSRPTVFRLLLSLTQTGFVEKTEGKYRLGWKVARLGRRADPYAGLIAQVQPSLETLAGELNETINYAVVNGETAFELIAEASGSRLITLSAAYIGMELPLHASAMGKLMLAELSDERVRQVVPKSLARLTPRTIATMPALFDHLATVRAQGYAMIDDELEESLYSLAVPIRAAASGALIGLLSVTGPSPRLRTVDPAVFAARLRTVAEHLSGKLTGARQQP
ncbi:MAG: hypothetical protein RIS85_998 [Pseudomonadota bacterium]